MQSKSRAFVTTNHSVPLVHVTKFKASTSEITSEKSRRFYWHSKLFRVDDVSTLKIPL